MPNQPATPLHSVRITDELWNAALTKTRAQDTTITAVIVDALAMYVAGERQEPAVWSVVRGASPEAHAVEPGAAGVAVPDEILVWAAGHGLDEAAEVHGEISYREYPMLASDITLIRDALRSA